MWHDMQWHGWDHHLFGWWGLIFASLVVVAIVGTIIAFIRNTSASSRPAGSAGEDQALEVLRRRYAEGEIDREEFEQRK